MKEGVKIKPLLKHEKILLKEIKDKFLHFMVKIIIFL